MAKVSIPATDGISLAAEMFAPPEPSHARGVLLINGATGVGQGYYRNFALHMADLGYHVLTWDYRGIGASRPVSLRGLEATFLIWAHRDLAGVLTWIEARFPTLPLGVIGHSSGGAIIGMADGNDRISAAITVASQFGNHRDWAPERRRRNYLFWYVFVRWTAHLVGYFPGKRLGLFEDLPLSLIKEMNALRKRPDISAHMAAHGVPERFAQVTCPLLSLGFTDDPLGTPAALERLHQRWTQAALEVRWIDPGDIGAESIDHFGFFSRKCRDALWPIAESWFADAMTSR